MKNKDIPLIRTIRYLGNKRKILGEIHTVISDNVKKGGIILDLFSGTNCVGYALKRNYIVYSNDIQQYSYIIAKALIENNSVSVDKKQAMEDLARNYVKNYNELLKIYKDVLNIENRFFSGDFDNSDYEKYKKFCDNFPYHNSNKISGYNDKFLSFFSEELINQYRENTRKFPYILFSTYFVNGYFGIKQCLQIDSLRYAIDQIKEDLEIKKMIYLTALIYAANLCVSSTGHFAQFRNVNSENSCKEIINERKKNIEKLFYAIVDELFSKKQFGLNGNTSFNEDYLKLLNDKNRSYPNIKSVDLVYADPPYTTDHYSRYYHVLETLAKYDYPKCIRRGRYRHDRNISKFSLPRHAEDEFKRLISATSNINTKLLLSYTNVGLVGLRKLKKICSNYYKRVTHKTIDYNHSNQGRKPFECNNKKVKRKEYLIYCE
jgi:adenine-specific DNA methylase